VPGLVGAGDWYPIVDRLLKSWVEIWCEEVPLGPGLGIIMAGDPAY